MAPRVSTLVNEGTGTGYVAGGYLRLKKILLKVDDFENELKSEHQTKETERFNIIERCNKEADDMSQGMGKFTLYSACIAHAFNQTCQQCCIQNVHVGM